LRGKKAGPAVEKIPKKGPSKRGCIPAIGKGRCRGRLTGRGRGKGGSGSLLRAGKGSARGKKGTGCPMDNRKLPRRVKVQVSCRGAASKRG